MSSHSEEHLRFCGTFFCQLCKQQTAWRCDQCNQHCHWSELIFKGNRDICDDCDERNKSGEEE